MVPFEGWNGLRSSLWAVVFVGGDHRQAHGKEAEMLLEGGKGDEGTAMVERRNAVTDFLRGLRSGALRAAEFFERHSGVTRNFREVGVDVFRRRGLGFH